LQVAWWLLFGLLAAETLQRVLSGDLDCFFEIGAYRMCDATQRLSIYTSLLLLMTQALVSRILVPGMSNFVNASVRFPMYVCDLLMILLHEQILPDDGINDLDDPALHESEDDATANNHMPL
jgi:hypothetical protein